jgi:Domain of unknown function (DUF1994).
MPLLAVVALLSVAISGCSTQAPSTLAPSTLSPSTQASSTQAPSTDGTTMSARLSAGMIDARTVLAALPVKGKAPKTGYQRTADFGAAWIDVDHNHCDTRDDILARDLTAIVRSGSCKVVSGRLHDPYTGKAIVFTRGVRTSTAVQIDHRVPLMNAWITGAQRLTEAQRVALANDPLELVAVDGPTNERKGDGDAATWLPPNKTYRCTYVADQVEVKARYRLWVTAAERTAISRILAGCPVMPIMRPPAQIPAAR